MDFSDNTEADSGLELKKLRPRGAATTSYQSNSSHQPLDDVVYLERDILPNDTLQSFSILYGCNINDLKRANNLITEQDFYALKRLKIPVKKFGLLTDTEEERKRRSLLTTTDIGNNDIMTSSASLSDNPSDTDALLPDTPTSSKADDTSRFLKTVDKQIRKSKEVMTTNHQVLEEVVTSLGSVGYRPLTSPGIRRQAHDECNGSDWGCKWWVLLLTFLVLLAFFAFIIYYEYNSYTSLHNEEHENMVHHHQFSYSDLHKSESKNDENFLGR